MPNAPLPPSLSRRRHAGAGGFLLALFTLVPGAAGTGLPTAVPIGILPQPPSVIETNTADGVQLEAAAPPGGSTNEVNATLSDPANALFTTNVNATPPPAPSNTTALQRYQAMLELGRQQRRDQLGERAARTFSILVSSPAPDEFKRAALLELAFIAQEAGELARAQQIFGQYVTKYADDPSVPELLLRQGLLYREMGTPVLALSKFYAVMSTALNLKLDQLDYYQRLVLLAQTEIADTYYLQSRYEEAGDFFTRLLRLESPNLNKPQILAKLVRCLSAQGKFAEAATKAEQFIGTNPGNGEVPEMRFLFANSLRKLNRTKEALHQVVLLLQSQAATAAQNPENWIYWQQRTGNEIANQFYQQGEFVNALEIYKKLAELNTSPAWQIPALYQAGIVYERLQQPQKAIDTYDRILSREKDLGPAAPTAGVATILEMTRWRKNNLEWGNKAEATKQELTAGLASIVKNANTP